MASIEDLVSFFKKKGERNLDRIQIYIYFADLYRAKWRGEFFDSIKWVWNGVQPFSKEIEAAFLQEGDPEKLSESVQRILRDIYIESFGNTCQELINRVMEMAPFRGRSFSSGEQIFFF